MTVYGEDQRAAAVTVWLRYGCTSRQALAEFRQNCPHPQPHRPDRFVRDWGQHWLRHRNLHDQPGKGRKSKVDGALVRQVVEIFAAGYQREETVEHWPSFRVAVQQDEQLAALVRRSGVTTRTFFLHMLQASPGCCISHCTVLHTAHQQAHSHALLPQPLCLQTRPSLHRVPRVVKRGFPPGVREERMRVAADLLTWPVTKVLDMIFVDAAIIQVVPASGRVWVDLLREAEREQLVIDHRLRGDTGFTLVYYACINARWGPCYLWLATGSTGLVSEFKVSLPLAWYIMVPGRRAVRGKP